MSWTRRRLGDLGKIVTGKTPSTKNDAYFGGEYLFVTPSDLDYKHYYCRSTQTTVTDEARNRLKNQFIPSNSVMFTCIGNTIGKCAISSEECLTNQQINTIIPIEDNDAKFIYYLLNYHIDLIRGIGIGGGAATPIINKSTFSAVQLAVPAKSIQEQIAEILSAYDDLIENNRRRIQLLEESARLLYREWFVHLRFPGHEHVKLVDGVPEGWVFRTIEELADTIGGGTPDTKVTEYWQDGDITWFSPTDLTRSDCLVLLDSAKKISERGLKRSSAKLLPRETIMMTSRASIGYFGLYDGEACTNQGFISIVPRCKHSKMYMLHNLLGRKEEILMLAGGTTYKEINKSTFRAMRMIVPPSSLLDEFESFTNDVVRQVRALKKQEVALEKARDLLLPRLMSGEIAV